ncbi:MAG: bifunctional methylenetetrahydrofolate dehydrogenase/methenyltetrahydrofolate cyclohydrolase, partial [Candidatus Komeilibacteria bacterium]|nr:bifunctional methylenetetrahydrofolate dehydrogenase/methenyltetrahydrofolate cyclohydrolase [Candidatus Komeilibacteria bacterium]
MLVDGKKLAAELQHELALKVKRAKKQPVLAVILVGTDSASVFYVKKKQELATKLGIGFQLHSFPKNIKQSRLVVEVKKLVAKKELTGCIVQLPLPQALNQDEILQLIPEQLDVDGLSFAFWTRLL